MSGGQAIPNFELDDEEPWDPVAMDMICPLPRLFGVVSADGAARGVAESCVNWDQFWTRERTSQEWIVEPIIPSGRAVALVGGAKTGKSELLQFMTASAVAGLPTLLQPATGQLTAVYLDLEMTEEDLYDRLTEMGFGPETDFSRLHYLLLPSLPPLDTREGGTALLEFCLDVEADLVMIDTTARAVLGEEDSSDTFRAFARHTGQRLKAAGITWVRADHTGKDAARGARGSSAKNDDVDVVWQATRSQEGLKLRATHRRMAWVPEVVNLRRVENDLRYEVVRDAYPAGTKDAADALDAAGVPLDASCRAAQAALRDAGQGRSMGAISAALRWRREQAEDRSNKEER
jgi:hypothetical protein